MGSDGRPADARQGFQLNCDSALRGINKHTHAHTPTKLTLTMSIIMEQEIFKEVEEKKNFYPQIESRATSSADRVQDEKAKRFFPQFGWKKKTL